MPEMEMVGLSRDGIAWWLLLCDPQNLYDQVQQIWTVIWSQVTLLFFLRFFFLTTIFKVFIEFVTIVLPFYVLGVLASRHVES